MIDALRRLLDAVGVRTTTARDALLGAVVAVGSVAAFLVIMRVIVSAELVASLGADPWLTEPTTGRYVAPCAVLAGQAMALTLRRRAPLLCLGLTLVGQLALTLLLPPAVSFNGPAGLVAAYSLGAYGPRRSALWGSGATAVVQVLVGYVVGGSAPDAALGVPVGTQLMAGLVSTLVTYLGAALVGAYVGTRRELLAGLRTQVLQAEREREALAAQAVLEERGRMARELHDVAAHHLSGIVVQASAAERLVDRDPARAKESLRWIRSQGRETLDNLRLVIGILRDPAVPAEQGAATPQPTLADVPELVGLARSTGASVRENSRGEPFWLPPTVERTVYRVLQEALSNARRHAPGAPVEIGTEYGAEALVVTVRNGASLGAADARVDRSDDDAAGRPPAPGHGIIGMHERAEFVGGTLDVGPSPGGGWSVRLMVPRPAARGGPAHARETPDRTPDRQEVP